MNEEVVLTLADKLPLAGHTVDGRVVQGEAENLSSIDSSLSHFLILPGIREVPMELFSYTPPYSVSEYNRAEKLSHLIQSSGWVSPLIVVEDGAGFYILEGGHRFDALNMLGAKLFPALVVKDLGDN